jgi:hypothetical protein
MILSRRSRTALAVAVLGAFVVPSAGCGLFSRSKEKPPEASQPAPPPAPVATPPPPRRPAGARIADEESLKRLVQGRTTKAEVRDLFGIPQEIVIAPGIETFIYYRDLTSGWLSRTTERMEMLTVRFDTTGVLKDFEYRYSGK